MFICVGLVYLVCVDKGQVYLKPLAQARDWYAERSGAAGDVADGSGQEASGEAGNGQGVAVGSSDSASEGDGAQNGSSGDAADGSGQDAPGEDGNGQGAAVGSSDTLAGDGAQNGSSGGAADGSGQDAPGEDGNGQGAAVGSGDGAPVGGSVEVQNGAAVEAADGNGQGVSVGKVSEDEVAFGDGGELTFTTVEEDYFTDAVFVGDSITTLLYDYGDLENITTFYSAVGMSVYKFAEAKVIELPGRKEKLTIDEALQEKRFAKVYLMLGINELGTGNAQTFIAKYKEVLDRIRELQPDAIIYVQAIMRVSKWRESKGDYVNNTAINERNAEIEKLADNKTVFFLDVNPYLCDETGYLHKDYTFDGVHLKAKYVEIWTKHLKEHAIVR